ncbi:unnamed protein product [Ceratitis capitata]|uniref:(Mediterranean fruit fly) hypothetical protein n=1 Tax=Ceratitis capitata TaxID=7213 RepID=A0A811V6M2_CERCA|nr:unnamed protein product [Ceratitis capitata]
MAAAAVEDEQLLKRTHCLAGSQTEALKQILDHSAGTEDLFHTTKRRNEATATVPGCVYQQRVTPEGMLPYALSYVLNINDNYYSWQKFLGKTKV